MFYSYNNSCRGRLRLSDEVIRELLYVREFAEQRLFFRRLRIPPLVSVIWHNVFVNHSVRKVLRSFVADGELAVREGRAKRRYKRKYPKGERRRYRIRTDFEPLRLRRKHLAWLFRVVTRRQRGYRLIDQVISLRLLALGYRVLRRARPKLIPEFARRTAMGLAALFR